MEMVALVSSASHLFYGLHVTSSTLFLACDAQDKLEGLQIIDQIIYRRKQGSSITLIGEGNSSLLNLPSEIWLEIKRKVILSAVDETEREVWEKYRCDSERRRRKTGWKRCDGLNAVNRGTLASLGRCDRCYKNVSVWSYLEPWGESMLARNGQIDRILAQFGLKRNSSFAITIPKEFKDSRLERMKSSNHIYELTYHAVTIASDSSLGLEFLFHSGDRKKASEAQSINFSPELFIKIFHQRVEIQRRFNLLFDTYKIRPFQVPSLLESVEIDGRVENEIQNDFQLARWIMRSVVHIEARM